MPCFGQMTSCGTSRRSRLRCKADMDTVGIQSPRQHETDRRCGIQRDYCEAGHMELHRHDMESDGRDCCWGALRMGRKPVAIKAMYSTDWYMPSAARLAKQDCPSGLSPASAIGLRRTQTVSRRTGVLDALGNMNTVTWMFQHLDQFFGIDVPTAEFLKPELSYWLKVK